MSYSVSKLQVRMLGKLSHPPATVDAIVGACCLSS